MAKTIPEQLLIEVHGDIDFETRLIAAIAYGEGSVADDPDEILAIAFATTNRARAWEGIKVSEMLRRDPKYTYAERDKNARFKVLSNATVQKINNSTGLRIAINAALQAQANTGPDPSNGAYWWDGIDLKGLVPGNSRISCGFKYGDPSHNIFNMAEISKPIVGMWQIIDKQTKRRIDTKERGRANEGFYSTAAHGKTIFWRYTTEYVKATGGKEYR